MSYIAVSNHFNIYSTENEKRVLSVTDESLTLYDEQLTPTIIINSVTIAPTATVEPTEIIEPTAEAKTTTVPIATKTPTPTISASLNKSEVYKLINQYRISKNLAEVNINANLETSAFNKAKDMVEKNYFEHGNPWTFISGSGYSFNYASENIAVNYFNSSSLIRGWQESPSHNQAMLDERNQDMGFAYLCGVKISKYESTCLAVIHFARPTN